MTDLDKVIKGLKCCAHTDGTNCIYCPYDNVDEDCTALMAMDVLDLLKEQKKEIKALHLLVEWAEECDFGFDQFPDEYELYKDEIKDMKYIDGMIHIAKRTLEDHGAFKEGR